MNLLPDHIQVTASLVLALIMRSLRRLMRPSGIQIYSTCVVEDCVGTHTGYRLQNLGDDVSGGPAASS